MTGISNNYRTFLQGRILRDFLRTGVIPTKQQINERLNSIIQEGQNLSQPSLSFFEYEVEDGESASASKQNNTATEIHNDLSVLYSSLVQQAKFITDMYSSRTTELKGISRVVTKLEDRASNLLMLSSNRETGVGFVYDAFSDNDKIENILTNASVDLSAGIVTLPTSTQTRLASRISEADIQFNVLTRNNFISSSLFPGSSYGNAFREDDSIWLSRVLMGRPVGSVTSELMVRLASDSDEVSKINISPASSDQGNITSVTIQYSDDGLNWVNASGESTYRLNRDVSAVFDSVQARYWKFVFNKNSYDEQQNDRFIYEFGVRSISFYGVEYSNAENETEGVLYSKVLIPDSGEKFNTVSFSACEVRPSGSDIEYHIAPLTEQQIEDYTDGVISVNDLAFSPIQPSERNDDNLPSLIDFNRLASETGFWNAFGIDSSVTFKGQNTTSQALDYIIPSNIAEGELKVLRNTGNNEVDTRVRGVDAGWSFDERSYSCRFYVSTAAGIQIDLGETEAFIDGIRTSGEVRLSKGYHSFSTQKNNWLKVDPSQIQSGQTANPDPLYPFNHKYLIEGVGEILYGTDMMELVDGETRMSYLDPDGVYIGVDLHWEKTMERVSKFDYTSNVSNDNYRVFSKTTDFSGDNRIIIKTSLEPGLMDDENFVIITRSVSNELFKGVVLKSRFLSQDSKKTPVLDEYVIKLGY